MQRSRRFLVAAVASVTTLVALPAYATVSGETPASAPGATPTRITPSAPATSASGGAGGGPSGSAAPRTTYDAPAPSRAVAAPKAPTISPSNRFAVNPSPPRGRADATWPDAKTVFTEEELGAVVPGLRGLRPRDCRTSELDGGRESANATRCVLDLTVEGEPAAVRSRLVVNIRGFGTPDRIGRSWSSQLADQQERSATSPARVTFYRNGSLGASGAYTDGTTTRVHVQRPGVAGEIWFSGIGFTRLKSDYASSRKDFRDRVAPALVGLLAAKMAPA